MDKDRLIADMESHIGSLNQAIENAHSFDQEWALNSERKGISGYLDKIEKGKYDKQPCDMCIIYEDHNRTIDNYNLNINATRNNYCKNCGRKLEVEP